MNKLCVSVPLLTISLMLLAFASYDTNKLLVVDRSEISISPKNGDRMLSGKPFTGLAASYYPDGKLAKEEQFVDGRRDGHIKHWFENGVLGFQAYYRKGRREGFANSWWQNGEKRSETRYIDDQEEGVSWRWYQSGEKFKRFNYIAGQPEGLQQGWRKNGKLFTNFEYKNGRVYGLKKSNLCFGLEDEEVVLN